MRLDRDALVRGDGIDKKIGAECPPTFGPLLPRRAHGQPLFQLPTGAWRLPRWVQDGYRRKRANFHPVQPPAIIQPPAISRWSVADGGRDRVLIENLVIFHCTWEDLDPATFSTR